MKKKIAMLLIGVMAAMTLLSGCSKDNASSGSASEEAKTEGKEIKAKTLLKATDYDVKKYVTLMDDYMNLSVELDSDYEVTDDAVQDYIESYVLPYYPIYTKGDKTTVESGDVVNIDYEGTLNGEAFEGGTDQGHNLAIGSGSFIDGVEDGLIGANVGDSLDLNLTFPEDYQNTELAGQAVVFHVTVNAIMDSQPATMDLVDDAYVAENFSTYGMNTVEDLNSYFNSTLQSQYESEKQSDLQNKVLEALEEGCTVEIPDGVLEERTEQVVNQTKSGAEEAGTSFEEYLSANYGYDTEEDFRNFVTETLTKQLNQELILEAIVADQKISINTAEFGEYVQTYVSYYQFEDKEAFYEAYGGEDFVMLSYAENLAFQSVIDGADVSVAEQVTK